MEFKFTVHDKHYEIFLYSNPDFISFSQDLIVQIDLNSYLPFGVEGRG